MKVLILADRFDFAPFERDGKTMHYARLFGRTSDNERIEAHLYNHDAVGMNKDFDNLTSEGREFRDMRFSVELEGHRANSRAKKGANGQDIPSRPIFRVADKGFRILTGPAQELHRARFTGAVAARDASDLAAAGDFRAAYAKLAAFVHPLSRFEPAAAPDAAPTNAPVDVSVPKTDDESPAPSVESPTEMVSSISGPESSVPDPITPETSIAVSEATPDPVAEETSEPEAVFVPENVVAEAQAETVEAQPAASGLDTVAEAQAEDASQASPATVEVVRDPLESAFPPSSPVVAAVEIPEAVETPSDADVRPEVTEQPPVSTAPAAPVSTAPAAPVSTAPAAPVSTAPAAPVSTAPAAPVSTAPAAPVSTAPAAPVSTAPAARAGFGAFRRPMQQPMARPAPSATSSGSNAGRSTLPAESPETTAAREYQAARPVGPDPLDSAPAVPTAPASHRRGSMVDDSPARPSASLQVAQPVRRGSISPPARPYSPRMPGR